MWDNAPTGKYSLGGAQAVAQKWMKFLVRTKIKLVVFPPHHYLQPLRQDHTHWFKEVRLVAGLEVLRSIGSSCGWRKWVLSKGWGIDSCGVIRRSAPGSWLRRAGESHVAAGGGQGRWDFRILEGGARRSGENPSCSCKKKNRKPVFLTPHILPATIFKLCITN